MGMFNFLKKKKALETQKEVVLDEMIFSEALGLVGKKIKVEKEKESLGLDEVRKRIGVFGVEIAEKVIILEKFDIDSIRDDERIKNAVREARKIYVKFLKVLVRDLKKVDSFELKRFVHEVNGILVSFNKKSFRNYERTTFLIGDEMVSIKNSLKSFSTDVLNIFESNKVVISSLNKLNSLKEKMNLLVSKDEVLAGIDKVILKLNKDIDMKRLDIVGWEKELVELKRGEVYLNNLSKMEKNNLLKKSLKSDILKLKQDVDFKGLANFFHKDSRRMNVVKRYKDHFLENFEKDDGLELIDILDEADIGDDLILGKIEGIRLKVAEIEKLRDDMEEDESLVIMNKIDEVGLEILKFENNRNVEEKRILKLKESREKMFSEVSSELVEFGISVIR
jgi:hypothetical protein